MDLKKPVETELEWDPGKLLVAGLVILCVGVLVAPFYIAFCRIVWAWTSGLIKSM